MITIKKKTPSTDLVFVGLLFWLASLLVPVSGHANEGLVEALANGDASMAIRYRYEKVTEDNALSTATAFTVRMRLGYQALPYKGVDAYMEFENVSAVGVDNYNGAYSVIADPEGSEVNQLYLSYRDLDDIMINVGRQRIFLDNARFVGDVGWRQNEQTFDALSIVDTSWPKLVINYAYLIRVNTPVFTAVDHNSHLINAQYTGLELGELSVYGYFFDEKESTADSATLGLRFKGGRDVDEDMHFIYTVEMAQQGDYADAVSSFDVEYRYLELGVKMQGLTIKLGSEMLAGNGSYAFETPLATKHAFNGWADRFSSTTAATGGDGLNDIVVSLEGHHNGLDMQLLYHDFSADNGEALGVELDFEAVRILSDATQVGFKYTRYRADSWSVDATKLWLWGELVF